MPLQGHRALDWGVSEVSELARGMWKKVDPSQPVAGERWSGEAGRERGTVGVHQHASAT